MENLMGILGMLADKKRIYRFSEENEVDHEEFQYCQLMYQIVFGEKGFADTLGPTWNLVHDPRFMEIEGKFIVERRAWFGGDARLGKQYINDDGTFTSTTVDLEQYAEILGEGRNFHNVLAHPSPLCPVRRWLERIYTGFSTVKPHAATRCSCPEDQKVDPSTFKDAHEEDIWALIQQECPNRAFDKYGKPTAYGRLMLNLIRADLVGLIHDYAETPLIDSYVYLRDQGIVVNSEEIQGIDPHGTDHQRVLQEIDILEQALTHRATLRVTAAKVLKSLGFEAHLKKLTGEGKIELTDLERDELLKIVYESNWPEGKTQMISDLLVFIGKRTQHTFEYRQEMQLGALKENSQEAVEGLKDGSIKPINHYTEPVVELPKDVAESEVMRYASMVEALTKNPLKGWLFSEIYVPAEAGGDVGVLDILHPIFDPNYELTEEGYMNMLRAVSRQAKSLRVMDPEDVIPRGTADTGIAVPRKSTITVEGEYSPGGQG